VMEYSQKEIDQKELSKDMDGYLDWVIENSFHRLIIQRDNKQEAVMVPIDEYERIFRMSESYEREQIAKIIDERVINRKTPKKTISHEEMMVLIEKRRGERGNK